MIVLCMKTGAVSGLICAQPIRMFYLVLQKKLDIMLGALAGDIIGSIHEKAATKTKAFMLFESNSVFTDDTVLSVAIAEAILRGLRYEDTVRSYARQFPNAGYGKTFKKWLSGEIVGAYNSWGNGAAMRVSPIAWAFSDLETVIAEAKKSAEITHDHSEGIKGAQAVAAAVFLARTGAGKVIIKDFVQDNFAYDLERTLAQIRPTYKFDVSSQGSVPESIIAFLEAEDFEDAVRNAVSLGGDSDTMASIAGAIAEAHFKYIPEDIKQETRRRIPLTLLQTVLDFTEKYQEEEFRI